MSEFTTTAPRGKKGRWGRTCYYRNPRGYITVDQYIGSALQHFIDRGFQRLPQYGDITRFLDKEQEEEDPAGNWGVILRHPDGPAEFPAAQVLEARWYKPDICPVPGTKFPQLKGMKIQEYQCPQCERLPFITAEDADGKPVLKGNGIAGLAQHLTVSHDWDRMVLLAYGERVGIDFNIVGDDVHSVVEYNFEEEEPQEVIEEPDFEVEDATAEPGDISQGRVKATGDPPKCEFCGWVTEALSPMWERSTSLHQKIHCKQNPASKWSKEHAEVAV